MQEAAETIGTCFGNYRAIRWLGRGSMGEVFEARHVILDKPAAVKVLLHERSTNEEAMRRFATEARAAASLHHPGLTEVYDFGHRPSGEAYIVMELLEGRTVGERVDEGGPLSPGEAVAIARQVAQAMAVAHAAGIVHRDLKPENLVLRQDEEGETRVKILDFGVAKVGLGQLAGTPSFTRRGEIIGTPAFMSPEQCSGSLEVDARSDVYALGCVLYFMLTGKPPFDLDGVGAVLAAHIYESPPPPATRVPSLPPELDAVVLRLLEKSPADRPRSMGAVDALLALVGAPSGLGSLDTTPATVQIVPALEILSSTPTLPMVEPFRIRRSWLVGGLLSASLIALLAVQLARGGNTVLGEAAAASTDEPVAAPFDARPLGEQQVISLVQQTAAALAAQQARATRQVNRHVAPRAEAARPVARQAEVRRKPGKAKTRARLAAPAVARQSPARLPVGDGALDPYRD